MTASEKSLLRAWGVMMALSIALAIAAEPLRPENYILAWAAFVSIVVYWKARIVLSAYLGLRDAPAARAGFSLAVAIILAMVLGGFALQLAIPMIR